MVKYGGLTFALALSLFASDSLAQNDSVFIPRSPLFEQDEIDALSQSYEQPYDAEDIAVEADYSVLSPPTLTPEQEAAFIEAISALPPLPIQIPDPLIDDAFLDMPVGLAGEVELLVTPDFIPVSALPDYTHQKAIVRALDKMTGRVKILDLPVGETVHFGTLSVIARTCQSTPPEETPEDSAFLDIVDVRPDSAPRTVFRGWMFSSSPALSAMEHAVYDIWVIGCGEVVRFTSTGSQ